MSVARITTVSFNSKEDADTMVENYVANAANEFPEAFTTKSSLVLYRSEKQRTSHINSCADLYLTFFLKSFIFKQNSFISS